MFHKNIDDRLSSWVELRNQIESSDSPLQAVYDFWKSAPFIPYNNRIDPFYQKGWPTPWEIITENKYDDFTKALMIGWSLKLTKRFKDSKIEIKTLVDIKRNLSYNIICVDDKWAINYNDNGPVSVEKIPSHFLLENLVELGTTW